MRENEKTTIRVITSNGGQDCVQKPLLSFYIKRGYVVALPPGEEIELSPWLCEELARQEIEVIYDVDASQFVFRPK